MAGDGLTPKIGGRKAPPFTVGSGSGFVYKRGGGILGKTHPPNFGPTHPTFDPSRPPPLL